MPRKWGHQVRAITACTLIGGWLLSGCTPTFNWREVRPDHADGLVAWFPCKPDVVERVVAWSGVPRATVTVLSCKTDGVLWALRYTQVPDAQQLAPTWSWWNDELVKRAGYQAVPLPALAVPGMTPQPQAKSWHLLAKGAPMHGMAWHFSHGLQVFQASVWQPAPFETSPNGEDVVLTFQKGFHFPG